MINAASWIAAGLYRPAIVMMGVAFEALLFELGTRLTDLPIFMSRRGADRGEPGYFIEPDR